MEMKLELVPVPAADVDSAKAFYVEQVGFRASHDVRAGNGRVVQLTPPGSACSIVITASLPAIAMQPGSLRGLHLVVADIHVRPFCWAWSVVPPASDQLEEGSHRL